MAEDTGVEALAREDRLGVCDGESDYTWDERLLDVGIERVRYASGEVGKRAVGQWVWPALPSDLAAVDRRETDLFVSQARTGSAGVSHLLHQPNIQR